MESMSGLDAAQQLNLIEAYIAAANRIMAATSTVAHPICAILTGMAVIQVAHYCSHAAAPTIHMAAAISSVCLCIILSVFEIAAYWYTVRAAVGAGPFHENFISWPLLAQPVLGTSIALISQAYFTSICCKLYKQPYWLLGFMGFLMALTIIGTVFSEMSYAHIVKNGISDTGKLFPAINEGFYLTSLAASMIMDVTLSLLMYSNLKSLQGKSSINVTKAFLDNILKYMLETYFVIALGSITSLIASTCSYFLVGLPSVHATGTWYAIMAITPRLYTNGLVFTLNRRIESLEKFNEEKPQAFQLSDTPLTATSTLPTIHNICVSPL